MATLDIRTEKLTLAFNLPKAIENQNNVKPVGIMESLKATTVSLVIMNEMRKSNVKVLGPRKHVENRKIVVDQKQCSLISLQSNMYW